MPNMNRIHAVFQKLLSGRTDGRMHARTGVTLNAPPPFFEWRGHKNDSYIVQIVNYADIDILRQCVV